MLDLDKVQSDVISELNNARTLVRNCLSEDERCRNDDQWLMLKVWQRQGVFIMIDFEKWKQMFSPETIRRVRQEIQSTSKGLSGEFLPTDPDVLILRKVKEDAIRNYYGTKSKILQEYMNKRYDVK